MNTANTHTDDPTFVKPGGNYTRPPGAYAAKIESVRPVVLPAFENRPAGPGLEWTFNLGAVEPEGEEPGSADRNWYLRQSTTYATGSRSTLAKWAPALGVDLTKGFSAASLVGNIVQVVVGINAKGYNKVESLLPANSKLSVKLLQDDGPPWLREGADEAAMVGAEATEMPF